MGKNRESAFAIASEHQLCRRFNVSRVTVRLALSDLENRGLIYRQHGKGTFAHGRATLVHRAMGILMKSPLAAERRPIAEMIRGVQTVMAALRSSVSLISRSPEEWLPEKASALAGVIIVPEDISSHDLEVLKNRNLPFYIFTETSLPGPHLLLGQRTAARQMTEQLLALGHRRLALFSGYDACLDAPKRAGVHEALRAAQIDPARVVEISAHGEEGHIFQSAHDLLKLRPRPTAVIALDDSLGAMLSSQARRHFGLKVPEDLSVIGFHGWPFLNYIEPALTTVCFEFFAAGRRAAEVLNRAALTGEPLADLSFEATHRAGQTVAAAPKKA